MFSVNRSFSSYAQKFPCITVGQVGRNALFFLYGTKAALLVSRGDIPGYQTLIRPAMNITQTSRLRVWLRVDIVSHEEQQSQSQTLWTRTVSLKILSFFVQASLLMRNRGEETSDWLVGSLAVVHKKNTAKKIYIVIYVSLNHLLSPC